MKLVTIYSRDLPAIADTVKDCINQGSWLLFTSRTGQRQGGTKYFLQADGVVYELSGDGQVLAMRESDQPMPDIKELVHFGDVPQPASLSNSVIPSFSANFPPLMA